MVALLSDQRIPTDPKRVPGGRSCTGGASATWNTGSAGVWMIPITRIGTVRSRSAYQVSCTG